MIEGIVEAVSIPVMAKCRIGHFVEAQVLQSLGVDFIDESEVLTPADDEYHVNKWDFDVPFVCGARNLGEALRRIAEGAAMIRTKGEPGTGNVVEAVRHMRTVTTDIARIKGLRDEQLFTAAKDLQAPYELVKWVAEHGCLPVVNFSAGGIATPADAALMMQLGCEMCIRDSEKAIYMAQAAESGKPEAIQEKMATGRLEKFFKESTLTEQAFVKNPDQSVSEYTDEVAKNLGGTIGIVDFKRFVLGEEA